MKKKIVSAVLTLVMAASMAVAQSSPVLADTSLVYTDTGVVNSAGSGALQNLDGGATSNQIDIDVQARLSGDGGIKYSVKVTWGDMKFEYDYGKTWDPTSHSYTLGSSGQVNGGWLASYIDGTNNIISVQNDSNFPIQAVFTYANTAAFNASPTANDVVGTFDANNSALKTTVAANNSSTASLTETIDLNMDTALLTTGQEYYYKGTDDGKYQGNMYFSLIGTPDRGLTGMSAFGNVGKITVTIAPATGVSKGVKP